jgi:enoyl-[acyl-carrier protein] reductase I
MIEPGKTYVVMGLLDSDSIAYAIGKRIEALGGKTIFTVQSERMKRIFLDRSKKLTQDEKDALTIMYCDITVEEEVQTLFAEIGDIAGVVHSIAYANPKTLLGEEFHTSAFDDLKLAFHISAVSLATVVKHAQPKMPNGGGVVCLSFAADLAFPYYNWMGVNKAALEACVKALARRHGRDNVRINAVSAGPVATKAGSAIPGFSELAATWNECSPLPWDLNEDKHAVADAACFLLGPGARKITGQTLHVDGGASVVGGRLKPWEREGRPGPAADPA